MINKPATTEQNRRRLKELLVVWTRPRPHISSKSCWITSSYTDVCQPKAGVACFYLIQKIIRIKACRLNSFRKFPLIVPRILDTGDREW